MKKILNKILTLLLIVSLLATAYFGYLTVSELYKNWKLENESSQLADKYVSNSKIGSVKMRPDLDALKKENADIVSWIYIPDMDVSEPIVHTSNNNDYIRHDLNKNYSVMGTLFLDARNNENIEKNYLNYIFGHKSDNINIRFAQIQKLEKSIGHSFYLYQNHKQYEYEIIGYIFINPKSDLYPNLDDPIDNAEKFKAALQSVGASQETIDKITDDKNYVSLIACKEGWDSSQRRFVLGKLKSTMEYH